MSEYIVELLKIYYLVGFSVIGGSIIKEFICKKKLFVQEYSPESIELDEFSKNSNDVFIKKYHII